MSTGSECKILQVKRAEWYYILEDLGAPKNAWDWREHARAYGPFPTQQAALQHLDDNHANPGGYSVGELPDGQDAMDLSNDTLMQSLIADAPKNTRPAHRELRMRW